MSFSSNSWWSRNWPLLALLVVLVLWRDPPAEADGDLAEPRYVTFCCQAQLVMPDGATGPAEGLHFAPCFEAPDTRFGRQCRTESLHYYPVAVRTDRTFSFDNDRRELIVYRR